MKDVIYVPKLRNTLLSVSAVTNKDYQVNVGRNNAVVKRADGSIILTATKDGQLYKVNQNKNLVMYMNR